LGCKCHAWLWESTMANSTSWCDAIEMEECRQMIPKLKKLGIKVLLNSNMIGKNRRSKLEEIFQDAMSFSHTLKSMAEEFETDGFSFDWEMKGTDDLQDAYASFLRSLGQQLGSQQELLLTGASGLGMTLNISAMTSEANFFSMHTYSFKHESKTAWRKVVSGEFEQASAVAQSNRYIPGFSVADKTLWTPDSLQWALGTLDEMSISRVGLFGAAVPDLPSNKTFFLEAIESWVAAGSGKIALV